YNLFVDPSVRGQATPSPFLTTPSKKVRRAADYAIFSLSRPISRRLLRMTALRRKAVTDIAGEHMASRQVFFENIEFAPTVLI
ncbi:MAG: hypothetical protein J6M03_00615, partial [Clostridia bacterium]|nr:hypothetical protein [Clostridia bacterium]